MSPSVAGRNLPSATLAWAKKKGRRQWLLGHFVMLPSLKQALSQASWEPAVYLRDVVCKDRRKQCQEPRSKAMV